VARYLEQNVDARVAAAMSRFLMPSDIGLLVLVELYTEGAVPGDGIIPILSFLASHTGIDVNKDPPVPQGLWQKVQDDIHLVKSIKTFESLLLPFSAAIGLPGRRLWDLFLSKLWAINSLDALHDFFDGLASLLATKEDIQHMVDPEPDPQTSRIPLLPNSPLALFVRRAQLEFNRLRFSDASGLWKDLIVYRQPTAAAWVRRNPSSGSARFDEVLDICGQDWGDGAASVESIAYGDLWSSDTAASAHCLDHLIGFQVAQMQSRYVPRHRPEQQADAAAIRIWPSSPSTHPETIF
jgi:anaphase-promoting complex subunit 5